MMPIRPFYLGENPSSPSHFRPQSMSQANLSSPTQRSASSSPVQQKHAINRQSMPPQRVSAASPPAGSPAQTSAPTSTRQIPEEHEPAEEEEEDDEDSDGEEGDEQIAMASHAYGYFDWWVIALFPLHMQEEDAS